MSIEAMKEALEALETKGEHHERVYAAMKALRQAIEQAEKQEYSKRHSCPHCEREFACNHHQWVGLTELEINHYNSRLSGSGVAEEIQAKLRERNT